MIKLQEITYVTVITVEIPDPDGDGTRKVQASVKLLPHDMVNVVREDAESGHLTLLPVRDCTLAELAALADSMEEEIPEIYNLIQLSDVADAKNATLTFSVINDREDDPPTLEAFFDGGAIVFPADFERYARVEPVEPSQDASVEAVEVEEVEEIPIVESPKTIKPVEINSGPFEIVFFDPLVAEENADSVPFVPEISEDNRLAGRRLELKTPYPSATDILFLEKAFADAQTHSLTSLRREVAGFIIGPPPEKQPDGRYVVHVTQMIPAGHTNMQGASVTYTPESWRQIHDWLLEKYPNEEQIIVGWYHTHPGFGIFLSNMDLFIHRNFFPQKWHIALVLDPVNKKSGYFCWDKKQERIMPYDMQWPYWAHSSW
ncbi:MAG: proteasome lid subunit RPN8/RPN11 [Cellvibrionaceae bacterium]|jgi:proteasome lid subunit RPN8/RPN11